MAHHTEEMFINSVVKMVMNNKSLSSGNSKDTTPQWVRTTIKRVEDSLADNIAKCKKKEKTFKKYLLHNRDLKRYEVWQKGAFGRDKFLVAAEYRREVEGYLYDC